MQIIHLVFADLLFVTLVAAGTAAMEQGVRRVELDFPDEADREPVEKLTGKALVSAYFGLTKPESSASSSSPPWRRCSWPPRLARYYLFIGVFVGGYMCAGAANSINMVIDRDIDGSMKRTSKRPTVTQSISSRNALLFSFTLAVGSFAILWSVANLLSAMLALAGLVFYVIIYTMVLKRRTWHNIVIGGAAGAFPPS